MYLIYLTLFALIIFTPEFIQHGFYFLNEELLESFLIFCFGIIGLAIYLGKETALIRTVREKLFLQRESHQIRKDLSHSYSYIGEMNRRFEIVQQALMALPTAALDGLRRKKKNLYQPIFDAVRLLTKSEHMQLLFVEASSGEILERVEVGKGFPGALQDGNYLLSTKKFLWDEANFCVIRSSQDTSGMAGFLAFEKRANQPEGTEVLPILVAEALFLFLIDQGKIGARNEEKRNGEYAHRN